MSLQAPTRRACETIRVTMEKHSFGYTCKHKWQELLIVKRRSRSRVLDCLVCESCVAVQKLQKANERPPGVSVRELTIRWVQRAGIDCQESYE